MKKILVVILFAIFSFNWAFSQNFESLVDTNKMWVVLRNSAAGPPFYNGGDSFAYKFQDSSLISEEYWMKLWESNDSLYSNWELCGYMKQSDRIVLFMDLSSEIDTLYNFTKIQGEMITTEDCELPVDSVTRTNFIGKNRLTMHISDHQYYDVKYYEGIGSNAGLLTPLYNCWIGALRYLICYYENGELKYHNDRFDSCNYNTVSVQNQQKNIINIYPNPVADRIQIDNVEINTTLKIYNSIGQLVYKRLLTDKNNRLNLPNFSGFCLVQLMTSKGDIIYSKQMIKNNW